MRYPFLNRLIVAGAIAVLSACGGGGGSASTPAVTISGTVASGAPMVGKVTVYDSRGVTRTTDILADGAYSVDVSGLTGPFLFRAAGTVAGRTVSLSSAATAEDGGRTINITPFTDLLVANVVGMAVENYLANNSAAPSGISASALSAANTALTNKLLPMLQSAGLSTSFDLLHSSFAADHTGFDKLMDAVIVSVNAGDNTATIVDKLNTNLTLFNADFESPATAPTAAAPSTESLAAVDNLTAIEAVLRTLASYFTNGVPSANNVPAGLLNIFDPDMLQEGNNRAQFLSEDMLLAADTTGLKIQHPVIVASADNGNILLVRAGVSTTAEPTQEEVVIGFKKVGGVWKFWGDRSLTGFSIHSTIGRGSHNGSAYSYARYLEVWIDSARNDVQTVLVTGPGLNNNYGGGVIGVKLVRSVSSATVNFEVLNPDGTRNPTSLINECVVSMTQACIDMSQMVANGKYHLRYFDDNGQELSSDFDDFREVPVAPPTLVQAQAHAAEWFANITSLTPNTSAGYTDNAAIRATWTLPTNSAYVANDFGFSANNDSVHFQVNLTPTQTSTLVGNWSGNTGPTNVNAWVFSRGPNGLQFFSNRSWSYAL